MRKLLEQDRVKGIHAVTANGAVGNGAGGNGVVGNGVMGNGAVGNGVVGNGVAGNGAVGHGGPHDACTDACTEPRGDACAADNTSASAASPPDGAAPAETAKSSAGAAPAEASKPRRLERRKSNPQFAQETADIEASLAGLDLERQDGRLISSLQPSALPPS